MSDINEKLKEYLAEKKRKSEKDIYWTEKYLKVLEMSTEEIIYQVTIRGSRIIYVDDEDVVSVNTELLRRILAKLEEKK